MWSSVEKYAIAQPDGAEAQVEIQEQQRAAAPAGGGGVGVRVGVEHGNMATVSKGSTKLFDVVAWVPVGRRYEARKLVKEETARRVQTGDWQSGQSYTLQIR